MIWIFGFGSLMFGEWHSEFKCVVRQRATLLGYQRAFNKKSVVNWGDQQNPGVTLNLSAREDSKCEGVAFAFEDDSRAALLDYLRRREGCPPTPISMLLADGESVRGLTYVYTGKNLVGSGTSVTELAVLVRKASGTSGKARDYVRKTFEELKAAGIEDPVVTDFWRAVEGNG
ncbi:gamma-glutamylcyclotransferase [Bradyrhizobium symbiodeficiens]|uniref:gamma-glutamylcyclotransferase n=1 Tax=Bradyrhizobium symbiodeficiens TaxID=1404367 RepID=UPI0030CDB99D